MVAGPEGLTEMTEPSDDKIELLVRSVLAAVDARLVEIRSEIQSVAADVEQRHREVLTHIHDLEHRWIAGAGDSGHAAAGGDPLAARMEQATQVLLERIEAMHQRNTMATNERFGLINQALEQLNSGTLVPAAVAVPMASLDGMNAPLRVGPPTGQVPIAPHVPTLVTLPPIPPLTTPVAATIDTPLNTPLTTAATATAPSETHSDSEQIDMNRLADLLSEHLGHISLPPQQN